MKNVCVFAADLTISGGVERVTANLAGLLEDEYNIIILSAFGNIADMKYGMNERKNVFSLQEKKVRLHKQPFFIRQNLRKFIIEKNVHIFISMDYSAAYYASIALWGLSLKSIYFDHSCLTLSDKNVLLMKCIAFCSYQKIVTLTHETKKNYEDFFHLNPHRVYTIPNYLKDSLFRLSNQYNINAKKLLSVNRLDVAKGLDYLLDVAELVLNLHTDWTWDVYGDGPDRLAFVEEIKKRNLENKVNIKGNDPNIEEKYKDYSMLIFCSKAEGFGMVLLEAKANNLPLISFNIKSGPNDMILNNENGFLIPPFQIEDMANKIEELMIDPQKRLDFSNHARDNIDQFSESFIKIKWHDLLEEL